MNRQNSAMQPQPEYPPFSARKQPATAAQIATTTDILLEQLSNITANLRHYQAFGDRQDLDESIFSLMVLEARLLEERSPRSTRILQVS
ncbi:MAG: hypothetical protein WCY67_05600 [Acidithiobacillus sp.]